MRDGIHTLHINGSMHHQIGMDIVADDPAEAKFAQIYMLDDDMQTTRRLEIFENDLDPDVVNIIHEVLHNHNTIVQCFKTARELLGNNYNDVRLEITGDVPEGEHPQRYNWPTSRGHVGGIVLDDNDLNAGIANVVAH